MAVGLGIASLAFGAASSIAGASKQKKAEKKQAMVEKYNMEADLRQKQQNITGIGADITALASDRDYNVGLLGKQQKQFAQGQRSTLGASGANVNTGSPLATMETTALEQGRDKEQMQKTYKAQLEKLESEKAFETGELAKGQSLYEKLYGKKRTIGGPKEKKFGYGGGGHGSSPYVGRGR
jgi:hypothetical protein